MNFNENSDNPIAPCKDTTTWVKNFFRIDFISRENHHQGVLGREDWLEGSVKMVRKDQEIKDNGEEQQ